MAQTQLPSDDARAPRCVHDDLGADLRPGTVVEHNLHTHGPATFEEHFLDAQPLVNLDTAGPRVVEHHAIELAAFHLPGARPFARNGFREIEWRGLLSAG